MKKIECFAKAKLKLNCIETVIRTALSLMFCNFLFCHAAFSQEHRPCKGESFYVSLGLAKFCIPQSYRGNISLLSDSIHTPDYTEAKNAKFPIPLSLFYIDLAGLDGTQNPPLLPLAGLSISISPDGRDAYEYRKNQIEGGVSSPWRYNNTGLRGRFKAIEEQQFIKSSNLWVKTNTYYLRVRSEDWLQKKLYFYQCDTRNFSPPEDSSTINKNSKFWHFYGGRECRSTAIELSNGLYAKIIFHDSAFPVEEWHLWESSLENLLIKMRPANSK